MAFDNTPVTIFVNDSATNMAKDSIPAPVISLGGTNIVSITVPMNHNVKIFNRLHFQRWQQKRLFSLNILNFASFLTEQTPKFLEVQSDATLFMWFKP